MNEVHWMVIEHRSIHPEVQSTLGDRERSSLEQTKLDRDIETSVCGRIRNENNNYLSYSYFSGQKNYLFILTSQIYLSEWVYGLLAKQLEYYSEQNTRLP